MRPMRRTGVATHGPTDLEWGVARGLAGFRGLAWAWAVAVLVVTRDDLSRPAAAIALLAAAGVLTALAASASIRRDRRLLSPAAIVVELAAAAALLLADGWVYDEVHGQTFGSAWPVAVALAAGVAWGTVGGGLVGLALGVSRAAGSHIAPFDEASALSLVSSGVLFTLAGGAAGAVMDRVRQAETTIARARAREEVARTLHDGVLQTLAVVQRRSDDPELASLARDQELDLRTYLAGDATVDVDLAAALRSAAAHVERRDGLRCELQVVDDDLPAVSPEVVEAVAGAAREALTNAAKHAGATRVTVFLDVDDDVFCSIKDDGCGFDVGTTTATARGLGIPESIVGRLTAVGGGAEIESRPGAGTEVRLRAPLTVGRR